ncbi:MAG: succinate dehydrogenase cytochrome b subunit [Bacteriovoracaceae bacterium]
MSSHTSSCSWLKTYLSSSVGKKQLMAISGLGLTGFTVGHLAGNFLIYVGPEAFNTYGHKLTSNPLIYGAEAGLMVLFLMHLGLALRLTIENNAARPQKYFMKVKTGRGGTFASSSMIYTGLIMFLFIISHLLHFKFGAFYEIDHSGVHMRDIYRLVMEAFQNPGYVAWYVISMIAIGIHLSHGIQSTFQSLGVNHPKYTPFIKKVGDVSAIFIAIGFSSIPLWAYFQGVK